MSASALIQAKGPRWTVKRRSESVDASGASTWTWGTIYGGVRIFWQPQSGSESIRYGRENSRKFMLGYAPVTLDIRPSDICERGARTIDIQSVRKAGEFETGPMAHLVLEGEETDGGT